MTRQQALKEAVRLWGKQAAVRDEGIKRASTPERRAVASAALKKLRDSIPKDRGMTREEKAERDRLFSEADRKRYTVGNIHSFCGLSAFWVRGQGDTWEEAFEAADEQRKGLSGQRKAAA